MPIKMYPDMNTIYFTLPFAYKFNHLLAEAKNSSNLIFTPQSQTAYQLNPFIVANKFEIGQNAEIQIPAITTLAIIACNELVLNGKITVVPQSNGGTCASGGGKGGGSGGCLLLMANNITGNGIISANGGNGENGSSPSDNAIGLNGKSLYIFGYSVPNTAGNGASYSSSSGSNNGGTKNLEIINIFSRFLLNLIPTPRPNSNEYPSNVIYPASGGAGATDSSTSSFYGHGGGGGASFFANGGNGGVISTTGYTGSGGGGGGGGGLIIITSQNPVPNISIQAKGGNGGNAFSGGGGGGGGGGGLIMIYSPSCYATYNVTGGSGGSGYSNGNNGENGRFIHIPVS